MKRPDSRHTREKVIPTFQFIDRWMSYLFWFIIIGSVIFTFVDLLPVLLSMDWSKWLFRFGIALGVSVLSVLIATCLRMNTILFVTTVVVYGLWMVAYACVAYTFIQVGSDFGHYVKAKKEEASRAVY